jgi:hypothetical protein
VNVVDVNQAADKIAHRRDGANEVFALECELSRSISISWLSSQFRRQRGVIRPRNEAQPREATEAQEGAAKGRARPGERIVLEDIARAMVLPYRDSARSWEAARDQANVQLVLGLRHLVRESLCEFVISAGCHRRGRRDPW